MFNRLGDPGRDLRRVRRQGWRACRLFQVKTASVRVTAGAPQPFKMIWAKLKGKRGKNDDWITITRVFASGRECARWLVWRTFSFLNSAGHVPAREITICGGEGGLLQCGRELPTRTADGGLFYSVLVCCCACTYVSFQSSPSFLSSRGWGLKAGGGSYSQKDRR